MAAILKSYLQSQKYSGIDWDAFKLHLQTNPAYPGLRAITDTLDHFSVGHMAAQVPVESFAHLPETFITYMRPNGKEEMAYATLGSKHITVEYGNGETKKFSNGAFLAEWTGNVLIVEENDTPMHVANKAMELGWWAACGASALLVAWQSSPWAGVYHALGLAGLYLGWLAFQKSQGTESPAADKICQGLGNGTGCNKLIDKKAGKLWGIVSYAGAALWYFALWGICLPLLGYSPAMAVLAACATAPVVATSLWAQYVQKAWCGLCLSIVGVLLAQAAIAVGLYQAADSIVAYIATVLLVGAVVYLALHQTGAMYTKGIEADKNGLRLLKMKKSEGLFDILLHRTPAVPLPGTLGTMWFGAGPSAAITVTGFTSPTCGYCQEPFMVYDSLLGKLADGMGLVIVMGAPHAMPGNIGTKVATTILHMYQHHKAQAWEAMLQWYRHRDEHKWMAMYAAHAPTDPTPYLAMLAANAEWAKGAKLTGTPATLLDGYMYPKEYDTEDLLWLVPGRMAAMDEKAHDTNENGKT